MHRMSWDKLWQKKEDGNIGFNTIVDFNMAMLEKQLWRLTENPNSLFAI